MDMSRAMLDVAAQKGVYRLETESRGLKSICAVSFSRFLVFFFSLVNILSP